MDAQPVSSKPPGLVRFVDGLSDAVGRLVSWLILVIVLLGSYNAIARYLSRGLGWDIHANALQDLQWYLFSVVFLAGSGWTLRRDEHVRVDVLYHRFPERMQQGIQIAGTVLFLIPFCLVMLWASWPLVRHSWNILEASPDPGGLPRFIIKTAIPLGFLLLLLQGCAELGKHLRAWKAGSRT